MSFRLQVVAFFFFPWGDRQVSMCSAFLVAFGRNLQRRRAQLVCGLHGLRRQKGPWGKKPGPRARRGAAAVEVSAVRPGRHCVRASVV